MISDSIDSNLLEIVIDNFCESDKKSFSQSMTLLILNKNLEEQKEIFDELFDRLKEQK